MKFLSTNDKSHVVGGREAVLNGLAPDKGLYFPTRIPRFTDPELAALSELPFADLGAAVASKFFDEDLPKEEISKLCREAFSFPAPLVKLDDSHYVLELFHGPTLAFKDFAARFMARLISRFTAGEKEELTILVATSGDTGSAVAHGFYKVPGVRVVVLYPEGKVSPLQESQMATLGENVTACRVSGSFDDCQALVKQAFVDPEVQKNHNLTSANSINIARLIPQSVYYFSSAFELSKLKRPVVISVPSGNFGNLTAGIMAKIMGAPIKRFMAATNANDPVPVYLRSGRFAPRASFHTISNAMDVGDPSNFARMRHIYGNQLSAMQADIMGQGFSDQETLNIIERVHRKFGYLLDPHGGVGFMGLGPLLREHAGAIGISLATAHPCKFLEVYPEDLRDKIQIPDSLKAMQSKANLSIPLSNSLKELKKVLAK